VKEHLQIKITLTTTNEYAIAKILSLVVYVDVPDKNLEILNRLIAQAGTTIVFADESIDFYKVRSIVLTTVGASPLKPILTAQSNSQCTIKLFDKDDAAQEGYINLSAVGY